MTPVGDIEIEMVFPIVVRGRTRDLARLLETMNKAQAVVVMVVEKHPAPENGSQKQLTTTAGGFSG